jgi:hypothetical protein
MAKALWVCAARRQREKAMAQDRRDSPTNALPITITFSSTEKALTTPGAREGTQPCPRCGHPMPDLKGGTGSICAVCGFKDSCCY